jgi:hypothetical protein
MMTKLGLLAGLMLTTGALTASAHPQINVDVHIGQPPPVVVYAPPTMVLLPEPQTYVAVGVPYDIFFISGRYYYLHGDHWFWGPGYGGPWTYVAFEGLPPGLRKYKVRQLREFREREYKVYKVKGSRGGTYFIAEDNDHPGKGRGRGHKH